MNEMKFTISAYDFKLLRETHAKFADSVDTLLSKVRELDSITANLSSTKRYRVAHRDLTRIVTGLSSRVSDTSSMMEDIHISNNVDGGQNKLITEAQAYRLSGSGISYRYDLRVDFEKKREYRSGRPGYLVVNARKCYDCLLEKNLSAEIQSELDTWLAEVSSRSREAYNLIDLMDDEGFQQINSSLFEMNTSKRLATKGS